MDFKEVAGSSGEVVGNFGEVAGSSSEVVGNFGEVAGSSGEVAGNSGEVAGNFGEVAGNFGEVAGNSGEVAGSSAEVVGNPAMVGEEFPEGAGKFAEVRETRPALRDGLTSVIKLSNGEGEGYKLKPAGKRWSGENRMADKSEMYLSKNKAFMQKYFKLSEYTYVFTVVSLHLCGVGCFHPAQIPSDGSI